MKPTQRKDALRNIGRQKVSYLSIVIIALMGVTAFLGICYAAAAMKLNGLLDALKISYPTEENTGDATQFRSGTTDNDIK